MIPPVPSSGTADAYHHQLACHAFRMTQDGEDVHELAERGDAYYHVLPQEAMPGHVKLTVKAGDVALFDTTTWVSAPT